MKTLDLPDLGEGLEDAEIVAWHVSEGDNVVTDQPLVSVETDKAVVEVPSPYSGRIARLHGAKGDLVKVGKTLVEFDTERTEDAGTVVGRLSAAEPDVEPSPRGVTQVTHTSIRATPAIRKLAAKLDVDLDALTATGPDGSISRADVERAARAMEIDHAGAPMRGMRRAMARRMAKAHAEVVPAGVMDDVDIGDWPAGEDVSVRVIRAIGVACQAEPVLNSHYNATTDAHQVVERIDIGIAVDTEDGLIVPVMRNVGGRDSADLRAGLDRLQSDAKARVVPPEELRGATITLSNFGMFGGRYAHLVVVPPQVAIVGVGRAVDGVVAHDGVPSVRRLLPITLIFDHRVITGGEGARFIAALKHDLQGPT